MEKTNALITGGAGFIGSHVSELLIEKGYDVTVLDNLSQGKREWVPAEAQLVEGDIRDIDLLKYLMAGKKAVFHLAAMSRVLPSITGGPDFCSIIEQTNIKGTINVLIAAALAGVDRVVYSASSTVYGNRPPPQSEETTTPDLLTSYAVSKYCGELYCDQFTKQYGLKTACLRYFQVYGPRQPIEGEYAMVTGIFLDQKKKGLPLTIHGDGSQRRDFVHVRDVAKANLLALEKDFTGTVNIGCGVSHSIKELADMISDNQVFLPIRQHDMMETLASTERCKQVLGWLPEISFEAGMKELL